jgi:hypothetical protein
MVLPCISLSVTDKKDIAWQHGYEGVGDCDLETLLALSRELVRSLQTEIEARQLPFKSELSKAVSECLGKLQKTIEKWKIIERLDKKETDLVGAARTALTVLQPTRDGKIYQNFLQDVHRQCNRNSVMLCAASLGKQRITALNNQDRVDLLRYLKLTRNALDLPSLTLVAEHELPRDIGNIPPNRSNSTDVHVTYCSQDLALGISGSSHNQTHKRKLSLKMKDEAQPRKSECEIPHWLRHDSSLARALTKRIPN